MNLLFLDTETTDKLENGGRLVHLAYKYGNEKLNYLFKPPVPISIEAMAVHHITNEMVEGCMPFELTPYSKSTQLALNENIMVAHNAAFDAEILRREGLEPKQIICTLKVAQNLFDLTQYKLQFLRYNFGLETGQVRAHDAEGDIEVLEALFNYLVHYMARTMPELDNKITMIYDQMLEWTENPVLLKRMSFGKHAGQQLEKIPKDYLMWLRGQKDLSENLKYTIEHYLK